MFEKQKERKTQKELEKKYKDGITYKEFFELLETARTLLYTLYKAIYDEIGEYIQPYIVRTKTTYTPEQALIIEKLGYDSWYYPKREDCDEYFSNLFTSDSDNIDNLLNYITEQSNEDTTINKDEIKKKAEYAKEIYDNIREIGSISDSIDRYSFYSYKLLWKYLKDDIEDNDLYKYIGDMYGSSHDLEEKIKVYKVNRTFVVEDNEWIEFYLNLKNTIEFYQQLLLDKPEKIKIVNGWFFKTDKVREQYKGEKKLEPFDTSSLVFDNKNISGIDISTNIGNITINIDKIQKDLSDTKLKGYDLSGTTLTEFNLLNADLRDTNVGVNIATCMISIPSKVQSGTRFDENNRFYIGSEELSIEMVKKLGFNIESRR